jgi:hypothetical protein
VLTCPTCGFETTSHRALKNHRAAEHAPVVELLDVDDGRGGRETVRINFTEGLGPPGFAENVRKHVALSVRDQNQKAALSDEARAELSKLPLDTPPRA